MRRNLTRAIVGGMALGAATFALPGVAAAAPTGSFSCANTATPTSPNGWGNSFGDERGQAGQITTATVTDSDGSLDLTTSASKPRRASYHSAGKTPLANVVNKPFTFEKSEGNANWQIRVTGANTGSGDGFATLVWSAPDKAGKTADAASSDQWWATRALPGIAKGQNATLAQLVAAANSEGKTTVVDDYGISSQPNTPGAKVNVDNVNFNGCTTNFAATGAGGAFGSLESLIP